MATHDSKSKKTSGRFFKKLALGLVVLVLTLVSAALFFVNLRKNEISKELLLRVNRNFPGEFTVGSIEVGDLLSYPNLEITVRNLQFWESKASSGQRRELIIDVPSARFKADLTDVMNSNFNVNQLELNAPVLTIERDSSGVQIISQAFSPLRKKEVKDTLNTIVRVKQIRLNEGRVSIIDRPTGVSIPVLIHELEGDFRLEDMMISGQVDLLVNGQELLDTLGTKTTDFDIRIQGDYKLDLEKRELKLKSPLTEIGSAPFDLDFELDYLNQNVLQLDLNSKKEGLTLENLLYSGTDSIQEDQPIEFKGTVGYSSHLRWEPQPGMSFVESLELAFAIEGNDLKLKGADLDKFIDNFKRSQNFNLADVSAVMFAGPAGLAITKGGDYASLAFASKGDSTQVRKFLAEWSMRDGRLQTRDVALSTLNHRISMDGSFNFVNDSLRFDFHVIDKKGCELVGQKISGTSSDYKMGNVNLIKTFLGPVKNFFQDLGLVKCEVVYMGRVTHPEKEKKRSKNPTDSKP